MKERVVTSVTIHHHRLADMPHFVRLQFPDAGKAPALRPIGAAQGVVMALVLSSALWSAFLLAVVS